MLSLADIRTFSKRYGLAIATALAGFGITLGIRGSVFEFHGSDLDRGFLVWCDLIDKQGFAGAMGSGHIDYNPTYLYLLWFATVLPFKRMFTIKVYSVICDYVCALAVGSIVYRVRGKPMNALLASFAVLVAPSIVFNGSLWGQCDMIYSSLLVTALATALGKRFYASAALFTVALAFKLQAIFLFPLLGLWVVRREFPLKALLVMPPVYLLCLVPAWAAGRPLGQLLMIYASQTGQYPQLTLNAPTIFALLPDERWFGAFGLWFAIAATFMVVVAYLFSTRPGTSQNAIRMATVLSCLPPFLLPHMHERYLFLADVTTILYAFLFPRRFWVPILAVGASFACYFPFLFNAAPIPHNVCAVLMGTAAVTVTMDLVRALYPKAFAEQERRSAPSEAPEPNKASDGPSRLAG